MKNNSLLMQICRANTVINANPVRNRDRVCGLQLAFRENAEEAVHEALPSVARRLAPNRFPVVGPDHLSVRAHGDLPGVLGRHKATRFVIEAEISSLGGVQFDGFVAAKRFDLNFRSRVAVGSVLRLGIAEIYEAALHSEGWPGQLNFARLGKGGLWGAAQAGSSEVLI